MALSGQSSVLQSLRLPLTALCLGITALSPRSSRAQEAPQSTQPGVTSVETFGIVTANQVVNGLGFNLDADNDWEFAAAAAAGAKHARFQCAWVTVEQQTAPPQNKPASPQYVQDPNCMSGFASAKKYGIHPTVVAGFGPPYHQILSVTIPSGAQVGATSLDIVFASGQGGDTLANIAYPYDYIQGPPHQAPNYGVFTAAGSYQGAFITGITLHDSTHATLKLASAVNKALPADSTQYAINEILYPSAATTSPTNSAVIAYGNYVSFLAESMANAGVTGDVELWNEPPWTPDPWDNRGALYDADLYPGPGNPGPRGAGDPNYGFVGNLQDKSFPPGITLTWNGTSGNGEASIVGPSMVAESGVYAKQPASVITSESFHPYGYEPEQMMWVTSCLEATAVAYPSWPKGIFTECYLPGEPTGTNLMAAVQYSMIEQLQNPSYGVGHSVTETGILPPKAGLRAAQARFIMRQYLGFEAEGVTPVEFFKLWDASAPNDPNFSFVEWTGGTSYSANPAYTALSGFMADLKPISQKPATSYTQSSLPSIASYSGSYPLTTVHMVGARSGASANSDMLVVWQRTYTSGTWLEMASPAAAPVTVNIPAGMKVTSVINLDTRATVSYSTSGQHVSFSVSDDPIEVLVDPSAGSIVSTAMALAANPSNSNYGAQVALTATLTPNSSGKNSTNGQGVTFYQGSTSLGTATLSSGIAVLNLTSLPVGSDPVKSTYAGNTYFSGSSGNSTVTVGLQTPSLTFASISSKVYGSQPFTVSASSLSSGAVTYSVASGPAALSGNTVAVTGSGTVTLNASQAAAGNYKAATAQTTFSVSAPTQYAGVPVLQFADASLTYPNQALFLVTISKKGSANPTGTIQLKDGSTTVATYSVQYSSSYGAGYDYGYIPLSVGTHRMTGVYSGDANYPAGTSQSVTITVAAAK